VKNLVELVGVQKHYLLGQQKVPALHDINLTIARGEMLSIIGPSGSGKSTLLHLIGLMDHASHGRILFEENDIKKLSENELARLRSEKIGFVFQDFNLLDDLTIEDNIALPLLIRSGKNRLTPNQKLQVTHLMEKLGLTDRRHHRPRQISGGQKQRAAIARALIAQPEILLANEPTGNLDRQTGDHIIRLLEQFCREDGITMIIVTHDPKIAKIADRIIRLKEGRLTKTQFLP
jgi:ABC-type lipoprotein export system ATPase subunit